MKHLAAVIAALMNFSPEERDKVISKEKKANSVGPAAAAAAAAFCCVAHGIQHCSSGCGCIVFCTCSEKRTSLTGVCAATRVL